MFSKLSENRGIAIVAVTMVLVVAALLGGAIITQTSQDVQLANRVYSDKQALYFAESAKERAYRLIMDAGVSPDGDINFVSTTLEGETQPGTLTNFLLSGGSFDLEVTDVTPAGTFPHIVRIVGTGDSGMERRRQIEVKAQVIAENVCVWNNAIFGGSGQAGGVVNGNAAIYGSVHLLGEGVGEGNTSIEALDLSGTALVHNNYEGMPADLLAKVPALPTDDAGLSTLNAKLRVKNGAVGVSGNSEIGQAPVTGATYKTSMDGIYIETDIADTRWTGTAVTEGVPDSDQVFSDNGTNALYDLGESVHMPEIYDPYEDPVTGNQYDSYDTFFADNSLQLPSLVLDGTNSALTSIQNSMTPEEMAVAGITLQVNGSAFTISQTTTYNQVNSLTYNPTAAAGKASLQITGMVQINGNLSLGTKKTSIEYSGSGTIYACGKAGVSGDISIHGNVLPATQFPNPDVVGFVAKDYMNLAKGPGDSQLTMAGAFYAGIEVKSAFQNQIAGTFVCNHFEIAQVPKLYQVPSLIDHLPRGLIGADPIWVITGFNQLSWQTYIEH